MDEHNATSFSNRNEAIPVIQLPTLSEGQLTPSLAENASKTSRKRDIFKQEANKLREKLQDVNTQYKASQGSMQERLFNTCVSGK